MSLSKGPYLTGLSEAGIDVRFELAVVLPAAVDIERDGSDGRKPLTFEDHAPSAMHVVHAIGLAPATRYAYVVRAGGRVVGQGHFTTAPKPDSAAAVKFLVYGDNRSDPTAHAAVVRALLGSPSDFLVNTGDMVEDGGRWDDWQSFFDVEAQLLRDRALFVAIGNHELYDDRAGGNFARYFGFIDADASLQPRGTVRLGNTRFFFLNAMREWGSGDDRQWLERELARTDSEPGLVWRIAVSHQSPWSSGPHGGSPVLINAHVPALLAAHGVDLVLSGHDHIYERGDHDRMKYLISGGGGAPLYRASKIASTRKEESTYHFVEMTTGANAIRLVARRIDGSVLDQCGFKKGEEWDCDQTGVGPKGGAAADFPPRDAVSNSRCGCTLPGARLAFASGVPLLAAALAVAWRRRRRHWV
ncbi:MAG: metallophosphoesterase family protein [Myxococcota bacterium]|nr:metallophosphoesterase family protein [Myxococcota bacterium]